MSRLQTLLPCILVALTLPGCKIVKTAPAGDATVTTSGEAGDDARTATILTETYDSRLVPQITQMALPVADLRKALAAGLDAAGAAHGHRGAGDGAAWNFAVKGTGKVVAANLESRARKADLDTDGDGVADVTLQLGPVIKGTALRDVADFYDFNDFRDQIAFAKLGRAINDRASAGLILPQGDILGQSLAFTGALALKSPTEPWLVTVVALDAAP
jgi:predicted lipoprotein